MKKDKPKLVLDLDGAGGNAFAIVAAGVKAARKAGWSKERIEAYRVGAMGGDYNHLLKVTKETFDVEGIDDEDLQEG